MSGKEFLERCELELREAAAEFDHELVESRGADGLLHTHHMSDWKACRRCRLERLADEAADWAAVL